MKIISFSIFCFVIEINIKKVERNYLLPKALSLHAPPPPPTQSVIE